MWQLITTDLEHLLAAIRATARVGKDTDEDRNKQLQETINNEVEGVLATVDQRTQSLHEELTTEIQEIWQGIQAMMSSVNKQTRSLCEELNLRI
jgi:DNA anti-recombination protein RmuC